MFQSWRFKTIYNLFSSTLFNVELVHKLLSQLKWDELECYVNEFLKDVQGASFHPHPGLILSIYEAQACTLNENVWHAQKYLKTDVSKVFSAMEEIGAKDDSLRVNIGNKIKKLKDWAELPNSFDIPDLLPSLLQYLPSHNPERYVFLITSMIVPFLCKLN